MTQIAPSSARRPGDPVDDDRPSRFGSILVAATVVLVAVLFVVPQPVLSWPFGFVVLALVVVGGGVAIGGAVAAVLRTAVQRPGPITERGATPYFVASGLCFFTLCLVAPAAVLVALDWWDGWRFGDPRGIVMTAVAAAALVIGTVFAVSGFVLLVSRPVRLRLAWAKVDLAVQVWALGAVLAVIAILY